MIGSLLGIHGWLAEIISGLQRGREVVDGATDVVVDVVVCTGLPLSLVVRIATVSSRATRRARRNVRCGFFKGFCFLELDLVGFRVFILYSYNAILSILTAMTFLQHSHRRVFAM